MIQGIRNDYRVLANNPSLLGLQFYFYPVSTLERVFGKRTFAAAGLCALQIEEELLPDRLNAVAALHKYHAAVEIGHTVVVIANVLKSAS